MNALVKVSNLKKYYKKIRKKEITIIKAVDGVDFEILENNSYAIIGASGCGKSTVIKLLFNLDKRTEGKIAINCTSGLVLQDPYSSLCPSMTVEQIIGEPVTMKGSYDKIKLKNKIKESLKKVNLNYDEIHNRYPHQISGGQRQRVAISRAVINNPKLLVLDEPTSMLDIEVKNEIKNILIELSKTVSILLVTHDIAFAKEVCENIFVMKEGKFIDYCKSSELLNSDLNEYTKKLILASTDLKKYWENF